MSNAAFTLTKVQDDLTPLLNRAAAVGRDATPIMRAMGTTFMSITMGNFHGDVSFRPSVWPAKKDGSASNLQRSGDLSRAFHLSVTPNTATVSNPKVYAAIHQVGGVIKPKNKPVLKFRGSNGQWYSVKSVTVPPRPYFPVNATGDALTPRANTLVIRAGERALARLLGAN